MKIDDQKKLVLQLAGVTMVGMPLVAILIDFFSDNLILRERLIFGTGGIGLLIQLLAGLAVGFVFAVLANKIASMEFMKKVSIKYTEMIGSLNLAKEEIVFISLSAGFGEEILFRAALQFIAIQYFGLWGGIIVTSVCFVAFHGYLSFKDWRISIYGFYMTLVICVLGFMTEYLGIWSAVIAHVIIDIYLLMKMETDEEPDSLH